jgi:DNA-binding response OmpR family regulator
MRPLAIVDSDAARAAELRAVTETAGFRADSYTSTAEALHRIRERAYALIILGLDLGDADPYQFCHEISTFAPIIAIARACASDSCIRALECGADDCVVRATSGRELAARIHSVLRRTPQPEETLAISLSEMRVRSGSETHNLTRGEAELLSVLLQHSPTPVDIRTLTERLGARRGTVESRIKSVRRKLGPGRLVSRGRLGYQIIDL